MKRLLLLLPLLLCLPACNGKPARLTSTLPPSKTAAPTTLTTPTTRSFAATPSPQMSPFGGGQGGGTPSPTFGPTATRTRRPTRTPTSPEPTSTLMPLIVWAEALGTPYLLPDTRIGYWSPTANEFLFGSYLIDEPHTPLRLAIGPDFTPITFTVKNSYEDFTWSPDGRSILYISPRSDINGSPSIWIMGKDGSDHHLVNEQISSMHYIWLKGWMNSHDLVYEDYYGGGHIGADILDIRTGERWSGAAFFGRTYTPNSSYIPATYSDYSSSYDYILLIISDKLPLARNPDNDYMGGHFVIMPEFDGIPRDQTVSRFEGWRDGANQLLAFWGHYTCEQGAMVKYDLLIWDVDGNTVRIAAPNGIGGQFSPDGKWLAYLTYGPAKLDERKKPVEFDLDPENQPPVYIQLLDMRSGKVQLSLPGISREDEDEIIFGHRFIRAAFSPDSRYLAFLTPGEIQVDASGALVSVITTTGQAFVNLLDLQEQRLLWATPASEESDLSWSPTSAHLAFQDEAGNWLLLDVDRRVSLPVTLNGGKKIRNPQWSFDGRYLSLAACPWISDGCSSRTAIFDITRGMPPGAPITLASLRMIDASTGWGIDADGNLVRTADGGQTWRNVSPSPDTFTINGFYALDADTAWITPASRMRIDENGRLIPYASLSTWHTIDGGRSWQKSEPFSIERTTSDNRIYASDSYLIDVQFVNRDLGWLLVNIDLDTALHKHWLLFQTTDGGMSWRRVSEERKATNPVALDSIVFWDDQTGWGAGSLIGYGHYPTWDARLYQTLDGGRTWQAVPLPQPEALPAAFQGQEMDCGAVEITSFPSEALGVTTKCMLDDAHADPPFPRFSFYQFSSDNGQTWVSWQMTGKVDFINSQVGWRLNEDGAGGFDLERTRDGGQSWTKLKTVLWNGQMEFVSEQVGWAIARLGEATALLKTSDGGQSWAEIKPVAGD